MLIAAIKAQGCEVEDLGIVPDTLDVLRQTLIAAMQYDVVITSGGVSMGEREIEERRECLIVA